MPSAHRDKKRLLDPIERELQTVVSYNVGHGKWTQVPCKSQCPWPLCHLSIPRFVFLKPSKKEELFISRKRSITNACGSINMMAARAVFNLYFKQICKNNKCLKHGIIFWWSNILLGLQMPIIFFTKQSPYPFTARSNVLDLMASC